MIEKNEETLGNSNQNVENFVSENSSTENLNRQDSAEFSGAEDSAENGVENLENATKSAENFANSVDENPLNNALSVALNDLALTRAKLIEAQADFENIKKRLEKEKISAVSFANESFARDLLGIIDTLEMALNTQIDESNEQAVKLKEGVSITIESFKQALNKHGVKMIETPIGGEFNPEFHNAMSYVESDSVASGFIAQIYQNGYMYNGRILRPTMVLIAK